MVMCFVCLPWTKGLSGLPGVKGDSGLNGLPGRPGMYYVLCYQAMVIE